MSRAHGPTRALTRVGARAGSVGVLVVLLVGCAGEQDDGAASMSDPGMGHVHGVGVDPAGGDVLAATHTGLFALRDGWAPRRVADRWQDTMAFTVDGDRLLGSGHPDMRDDLPVHLGLIQSTDSGETWDAISLQGEADLHALSVNGQRVAAWDSVGAALLLSDDGGRTWTTGASLPSPAADLLLQEDGSLLITTAGGLLHSTDGQAVQPFEPPPPTTLAQVEQTPSSVLVGVDTDGAVWTLDGTWTSAGSLPGPPTAFAGVGDGTLVAATEQEVLRSPDAGATWQTVAAVGAGGS
ncbi:F510_1955 family glycosylhydrolase [Aquipuribacter hungaricus]|uniref:F510_1955 family glycosylhydrolase n=1 Tax=Aquipuribacter hungaricus TaxID=545624 RepID=A0ABV7WJZ9_9MICO